MALFRLHKGSLEESLKTTVIVKGIDNLCDLLECYLGDLKIEAYPDSKNNFDERIGWYTHIVMVLNADGKYYPTGFLSEEIKL